MMTDRMTVAREALTKAAAAFREYQAHHNDRALATDDEEAAHAAMAKAARNRQLATECEMALNLLSAQ